MKEILKRTSSPYVVLIILLLMGIVPFTNSHGQPVEPGYSQYPIALGSVSAMSDNTIHTTSFWSGRVTLDGNKLGNPIPAGSYAVITVDSTYLESFTVPAATIVTGSRLDKAAGPNIWNMYVNLDRMDSATTASFLYNLKFKNRVTPEGYQVTPQVDLYIPAGTPALTDDIHIGTSLEDPAMQPTVTIKTNEPVLNKHIISNASNTTFALDNRVVYGGLANADSTAIESPADVAFQYTMSTTQGYQTVNGEFQGWGDGKNRTRAQSQIVITDTLPTYTKMDGSTGTASFDPAKNPGWTDNGDGTVSYTVNETAPGRGDADNQLMNTVKLLLQFPEAKLDPYRAGLTNFTATSLITNTAKAELHPVNESDYEKENKVAPTDSINFRIDNNPTKQYDGVGTQFFKNTNMAGRISVDPGSMDQYDATFSLSVTNINPEPMTNIVITDGPFDSRHYLKKLYGGSSLLAQNIQTIYGVKADGTKVPIDGLVNATRTGFNSNTIIDQSVYDQIAGYVAQVKAGTLSEEDVPPVPATYTSIEIELKPEFALQPGQSFGFLVGLGYTDPYHLTVAEPSNLAENIAKNTLRNEAKMTGEINGYDFLGTGASSNRLYAIKESFGMTKSTGNNLTGTPGEELRYSISFQNNLAKARQFNNARIVDVLPEGVTFKSTYPVVPSDKITLVDNFMGSGKQAVIIDLGTVLASDMPSKNISIYATINDNATPSSFAGANEDNMNYTYLMADNWKDIPAGVAVNTLLPDIHNLNGDGTTESIIGSKSTFTALMPTDVTGVKYVRAGTSGEWSLQPVYVNYDSPYQYKLTIRNNEGEPLNEATIYDILPFNGDTYYNYEGDGYPSRNSAFSGLMTGPVEAPEGFTVMYRTDSYMPPNPDAGINDSQAWKTEDKITDWNLVKGFKISTDPGTVIGPYSTTDFIVNMKTRTYVLENNLNNVTSNNSFAIRYNERDFGQSNLVSVYLTQAFPVKKVWDGGPEQKEEVYVQLVRDGIDMPDRILPLNEANDWEASFGDLPVYSPFGKQYVYTVREVNTPINYTSNVVGNQTEGFTLTNTYVSPELEITGRKIWDGGPNTDDYQVALQLYRWIGDGDYTNGPDGELDPKDEFDSNGLIAKEAVGNVHYVNKDNNWTSSKNNPINNKDGVPYNYVVREVKTPFTRWDRPENYDQIVNESTDADGNLYYGEKKYDTDGNVIGWAFDVTNKYKSPIGDILTSKVWVGGDYSYPKILIDLYRYKEGQDPSEAEKIVDGVSSATTNISPYHIYKDMPLSDETDGVPYVYRIEEVDLSALTPEEMISRNISQADVDQFSNYLSLRNFSDDPLGANDPNLSIINEYISPRLMVEGRKTWVGGDAENRPEVTLQLLQNGEAYIPKQTLTGTGVPGSLIQVNSGTPAVHTTKVHPDGNWYLEYNEDISQEATLKIVQTETGKDGSDTVIWQGGASTTEASTGENPSAVPTVTSFKTPPGTITVAEGETAQWNVPRTDFFEQNYNYQVIEVEVPENYTDTYSTPVEELDEKGNLVKLTQEVINTYTPDTIEVTANKEWQGGPETKPGFELQLYRLTGTDEATKTAVGQPVALLTETSHTWNVPEKDADGNLYTYFVEESTPPENYTASYKVLEGSEDKLTIVNTFTPEPIKIPVQKVWMGGALEDRPETLTVGLYIGETLAKDANGEDLLLTLNSQGQWQGEFANVPTIGEDLNPIEYNVKETIPEGFKYTPVYEGDQNRGFRITNNFVIEKTDITAEKKWVGGENIVGGITRPPVQVQLLRNLVPVGDPVWVDGNTDTNELEPWKYTWKEMPRQDMTGTDYIYTIQEVNVPENFVADHDGLTVTNTYTPAQRDFTATKVWEGGPADHPAAVFQLYRTLTTVEEKEAVGDLIYVRDDVHTWRNLPVTNSEGQTYSYWVEETNIPDNYTSSSGEVVNYSQTITNTYEILKGTITGYKSWVGGPAEKPDITLILERQIGTGPKEVVAEQNLLNGNIDAVWENIEQTDINGNPYIFSVREKETPANYTVTYNGMTAINTYAIPKDGVVQATKIWEGGPDTNRPDVYFALYRQVGTGTPERVPNTDNVTVSTLDGETSATVSWSNIETKDANGNDYIFTVKEVGTPSRYTKIENGLNVTNTYKVDSTSFTATKKWVGGPAEKPVIGLQLKQRLEMQTETQAINFGTSVALTDATTHEWTDLPKTDVNGIPYIYSVDETSVPRGYQKTLSQVTYTLFGKGRQTITNTMEAKDISFEKTWVGGPAAKPSVTIGLRVNGEQITDINGKVVSDMVLRNGVTEGSFQNLPYYDAAGEEIQYSLVELEIGGIPVENGKAGNYNVAIQGNKITNTYIPEKTTINVEKVWEGGSEESHQPVEVQLFRQAPGQNKEFVGDPVSLTGAGNWKYQWTDLDETTLNAMEYQYTVEEINPPQGYTAGIIGDGSTENPFVLTNTYNPDKADITAFKKWIGGPIEKPAVDLTLYRKTEAMEEAEIVPAGLPLIGLQNPITIENGDLSYTWKNLPVTDGEGNAYTYSVVEANPPEGYSVSYDGMMVTNTFASENTTITAEKVWTGGPEADHIAPEFVLYQNGKELTEAPTISPDTGTADRFTYTWEVPKTDEFGQDYQYSVDERTTPEGYGKFIAINEDTGTTTITNTFEAKATDISVHKDWVGGSDYPDITFELQRRIGTGEFERVAEEVLPTGDHIHIWKGQPLTNEQNQAYEYRVIETKIGSAEVVDNKALTYTVTYGGSVEEGFTITNTSDNALEIPVTKVWVDNDDAGQTRPAQITFTAVREDGQRKSQVFDVTEENTYTITGLEKYKLNSTEEYTYTIEETDIGSYEALIEGTTVTNTLKATKDLSFTKTWVGGPEVKPEITVELRANGKPAIDNDGNPVGPLTLTNGQEEGSFTNLPVYTDEGEEIDYAVIETTIDGVTVENNQAGNYTVQIEGTEITNTYVPEKKTVEVEKEWKGGDETNRPPVEVQLFRQAPGQNKEFVGEPVILTGEEGWKYQWTDLDETTLKGLEYEYTVEEINPPQGYTPDLSGAGTEDNPFILTNTYNPDKADITAFKKWIGGPVEKPAVELTLYRKTEAMEEAEIVPA
ncbi:MAG: Cna B-type domain-containing protein, partial [Gallicola sp.]|nr:Cna B-type domain-containing protein [Gallicola sp.]